jgi:dsRNA-specific ribonuclease
MQLNSCKEIFIYKGKRGQDFKNLIFNLLSNCKLKKHYIDLLTDDKSINIFENAFTSDTADLENNYEVYEQLGDITANKFIVWYMYRRFPQLNCTKGVKVVARLRINYGAKQSFANIADSLGFWDYISASEDERNHRKKALLEDTLEAFLGATERLIDDRIKEGVGYVVVYNLLKTIFDKIPISLKYEDLYDAKTRLKELFDFYPQETIGSIEYISNKVLLEDKNNFNYTYIYLITGYTVINNKKVGGKKEEIGLGTSALKADSEQKAALKALCTLNSRGFVKPIPEFYNQI